MPLGAPSFHEGLRWATEVYHALGRLLHDGLNVAETRGGMEGDFVGALAETLEAESITRVLHLDEGTLHEYKGTYTQYLTSRAKDEERLAKGVVVCDALYSFCRRHKAAAADI